MDGQNQLHKAIPTALSQTIQRWTEQTWTIPEFQMFCWQCLWVFLQKISTTLIEQIQSISHEKEFNSTTLQLLLAIALLRLIVGPWRALQTAGDRTILMSCLLYPERRDWRMLIRAHWMILDRLVSVCLTKHSIESQRCEFGYSLKQWKPVVTK